MHLIFFIRARKRFLQIVSGSPGARRRNDTCMLVVHSWTYSPCRNLWSSGGGGRGGGGGGGGGAGGAGSGVSQKAVLLADDAEVVTSKYASE